MSKMIKVETSAGWGSRKFTMFVEKGKGIVLESIGVVGPNNETANTSVTFIVGDLCEFDSFNFVYTAKILQITDKSVIVDTMKQRGKNIRMKLENFAWKNYDFDLAKISKNNTEVSYSI